MTKSLLLNESFIHYNYWMKENLELDGQTGEIRAVWKLSFLVPSLHHWAHGPTLRSQDGDRSESQQRHHAKALNSFWSLIFSYQKNENRDFLLAGTNGMKVSGEGVKAERKEAGKRTENRRDYGAGSGNIWCPYLHPLCPLLEIPVSFSRSSFAVL